ncbi:hypothetical protein PYW07_017083 [Mythimna separata]|uniref:Cathepsin propeptide inhibitor domain-containing protein n=1 Tax=Mythimna separata TaxID=271217 RepID=A0AAD7YVZ7_MYTSE|nr:hypothetical protein PYW07_017083 [Mythimna separata]
MSQDVKDKMKLFERFKESYGRVYPDDESEKRGFHNFVNNLAEVSRLNKAHHTKILAYELNRYADLDPEAIKDQFGLDIKPYDNMEHGNKEAVQRERKHKFLEDMKLYDLNEMDDLYRIWIAKYGKANFTEKLDNIIHYYRFAKSVAEANKKKFAGQDVSLGIDADQVQEPNQYFYG